VNVCQLTSLWQPTLKDQVCSLDYKSAATWRRPTCIRVILVNSRNRFAIDDSTMNIVLVIIVVTIIIIIIIHDVLF